MKLNIKKLHDDARIPTRAHKEDAGLDLRTYDACVLPPHTTVVVPIGIVAEIPDGYALLFWDKSSVGSKGIKTLGGVIDSGYRGELKVILHNLNDTPYTFARGDKVAQMLIQKVELCEVEEVVELSDTVRGESGFGSTGK